MQLEFIKNDTIEKLYNTNEKLWKLRRIEMEIIQCKCKIIKFKLKE